MTISVRLPSALKSLIGAGIVNVGGATVAEALFDLCCQFPDIEKRLLTPDRKLNKFLIVCINGEDVRLKEGVSTLVFDGDEISIIPAISGG